MSLATPRNNVQKLQTALQAKAKAEPDFRFYSLWDKIYRIDVLREAWRRCRNKGGSAGVDGCQGPGEVIRLSPPEVILGFGCSRSGRVGRDDFGRQLG